MLKFLSDLFFGFNRKQVEDLKAKFSTVYFMVQSEADPQKLKGHIIEADKILDHLMKAKGYKGETFADRLKNTKKHIKYEVYDNLWKAHKLRNKIVHEMESEISLKQAKDAMETYRKGVLSLK